METITARVACPVCWFKDWVRVPADVRIERAACPRCGRMSLREWSPPDDVPREPEPEPVERPDQAELLAERIEEILTSNDGSPREIAEQVLMASEWARQRARQPSRYQVEFPVSVDVWSGKPDTDDGSEPEARGVAAWVGVTADDETGGWVQVTSDALGERWLAVDLAPLLRAIGASYSLDSVENHTYAPLLGRLRSRPSVRVWPDGAMDVLAEAGAEDARHT